MEKSKKSQNEKSFLKNPISSIKFELKNFQSIFVISVFLVFIFIMAATAISVWINKQAEPPTVEEYCANCKVLNVQENLLKSPSTSLPVLRIFGKDIQVCHQTCQNLRPIFNIQFECVPMAQASKETIKEVYTAFDFLQKGGNLAEYKLINQKLANKENLNEKKEKYILFSSSSSSKKEVRIADQKIASVFKDQNTQNNQKKADQAAANLFLGPNPRTAFFIGGHIFTLNGIPGKEDICEIVDNPACPPKNSSSSVPKENFFGLVKNCYAWIAAAGGSPSSGGGSGYTWLAGGNPGTSNNSNNWTQSSSSSSSSSAATAAAVAGLDDISNWDSLTWNSDGSVTIGGNGVSTSVTQGYTGHWDGGTFNVGNSGPRTAINIGGRHAGASINISSGGFTFTSETPLVSGNVIVDYSPNIIIDASGNIVDYPALWDSLNDQNALSQAYIKAMMPGIADLAAPADYAWIAQILSDPNQNFYYALTHEGLATDNYVQTGALITESAVVVGSNVFGVLGNGLWDNYFYSGSPKEITTSDGSNWKFTMMTRVTSDGSSEFLAYNPTIDNGDGTFGAFVSYDHTDSNANEIAYAYQLAVPTAGTSGSGTSGSGLNGSGVIPSGTWTPSGTVNNPPIAAIDCDCPLCETTASITLNNNSQDLEDGENFSNCLWNIYKYPDLVNDAPPSPYITCDDLPFLSLQVGDYQAKLTVTDQGVPGLSDTATRNFYILQAITAMFVYNPEKPYYGEEVQFLDQSVGTGKPGGAGNYNITNWDWTFEDIEGNEITQTFTTTNFSEKDPIITFTENGTKTVTLTVTDITNRFDTYSEDIYVRIPMPKWKEVHPGQE